MRFEWKRLTERRVDTTGTTMELPENGFAQRNDSVHARLVFADIGTFYWYIAMPGSILVT